MNGTMFITDADGNIAPVQATLTIYAQVALALLPRFSNWSAPEAAKMAFEYADAFMKEMEKK